jgi:predicted DCC family thiol-disulfide oxidoreductase YuxK
MNAPVYRVFYDARCRICQGSRQLLLRLRPDAELKFIDINDPGAIAGYPQLANADLTGQMHVIDPSGQVSGGYDAFVALTPALPPLRPVAWLLRLAPIRAVGRWAYWWIARHRYRFTRPTCAGGVCRVTP